MKAIHVHTCIYQVSFNVDSYMQHTTVPRTMRGARTGDGTGDSLDFAAGVAQHRGGVGLRDTHQTLAVHLDDLIVHLNPAAETSVTAVYQLQ